MEILSAFKWVIIKQMTWNFTLIIIVPGTQKIIE